jgi:protocatechuate 3,4-dioxygenase alpha subunit
MPFPEVGAGRIVIEGVLRDGAGTPVPDGLLETWQADSAGRYQPHQGAGRIPTDQDGRFRLDTVMPGAIGGASPQAPHIVVRVLARGILTRLLTRIYFPGEPGNDRDPVLLTVPEPRRPRLLAEPIGPDRYRFDIVLQGPGETVFFDV